MKMLAALWYGPEQMRVEETDVPSAAPGEVVVKIGAALTCGTDFKLFRRGHPLLAKTIPAPFGHEMAGVISEVGSGVTGFQVGDRVVAANSAPCGGCFFCQRNQWNLCTDLEFLTGAYAEYIRVSKRIVAKNLYKIPATLSFEEAASAEPLACVVHAFERLRLQPKETLCVIGAGPCGLFFTQLGKLAGAKVLCIGRSPEKLVIAKKLGADETVSTLQVSDVVNVIQQLTPQHFGADAVVESVGMPDTWELATRLARKGGRVCFYGGCAKGTEVKLDTYRVHYEELNCFGVFHHTPPYFSKAVELIATGKIDVKPIIAGRMKLKDLGQVYQKGVKENPLKIAIIP